jgi:tetratricopeptide (TPR) repeat protein
VPSPVFKRLRSRRLWLAALAAGLAAGLVAPHAWAWHQLRSAYAELGRYHPGAARQSLASCLRIWPNHTAARLLASRAARQDGDLGAADRELRACQRSGGATEETAFEWALLQASAGNVREVEEYLQKRADRSPQDGPLVWEALAEGYLRVYRTLDAMSCLNYWLKRDPDNVRALELRGMTFVTGKGVVKGADDYRRVLALDPDRKQTRWRLIDCLISLGTYDEAAAHLEVVARERPGDPEVTARLARCYNMLSRGEEARRLLDDALAAHPDNGPCLRTRGQFALADRQRADAEALLRRAAAVLPEDYQTQFLLFQALQAQGKLDEAKTQLQRAEEVKDRSERIGELRSRKLAEQPLDPALHYEMAMLYLRTGHPDAALQWLTSALTLDPNHRPSHAALADYFERRGDKASAEEHRKKAAAGGSEQSDPKKE